MIEASVRSFIRFGRALGKTAARQAARIVEERAARPHLASALYESLFRPLGHARPAHIPNLLRHIGHARPFPRTNRFPGGSPLSGARSWTSKPPHVGLSLARNFSSRPAIDVVYNASLATRMAYNALDQKPRRRRTPARRVATSTLTDSSCGSFPSALSDFDDLSAEDIFQPVVPVVVEEPTSHLTIVFPRPVVEDRVGPTVSEYSRLVDASLCINVEHIEAVHAQYSRRLVEAIDKLRQVDMLGEVRAEQSHSGQSAVVGEIKPGFTALDVYQALAFYPGDSPYFRLIDRNATEVEAEDTESITTEMLGLLDEAEASEPDWIMPRLDELEYDEEPDDPLPFDPRLAQSVADTISMYSVSIESANWRSQGDSSSRWSEASF